MSDTVKVNKNWNLKILLTVKRRKYIPYVQRTVKGIKFLIKCRKYHRKNRFAAE